MKRFVVRALILCSPAVSWLCVCSAATPPSLAINHSPSAGVQLTITGQPGDAYAILSGNTPGPWMCVGAVTNVTGTVLFYDTNAPSATERFYGAVLLPAGWPNIQVNLAGISIQPWDMTGIWQPTTQTTTGSGSNLLITLGGWWDGNGALTPEAVDSNGTLTLVSRSLGLENAPVQAQVAYEPAAAVGLHTITPPSIWTSGDGFFLLLGADGIATNSPIRDSGYARQSHPYYGANDPDTIQSITVVTDGTAAQVGDLEVAIFVMDNDSNPDIQITLPTGWTSLGFNDAAVLNVGYRACYRRVASAGSQSVTCSWVDNSTFVAEGVIVVFRPGVAP